VGGGGGGGGGGGRLNKLAARYGAGSLIFNGMEQSPS